MRKILIYLMLFITYGFADAMRENMAKECRSGDMISCAVVETMNGNHIKAIDILIAECAKNNSAACKFMTTYAYETNPEEVVGFLKKACENGASSACNELDQLTQVDYQLINLCNSGNTNSCVNLGAFYGEAKDYQKAKFYLEKACDGKNAKGCMNLVVLYGQDKDYQMAKFYLEKACDLGEDNACKILQDASSEQSVTNEAPNVTAAQTPRISGISEYKSKFYRDDNGGVVIDPVFNLMWQDAQRGIIKANWSEAKKYCENLSYAGYSNWRLPSINELLSIVDHANGNIAINSAFKYISNDDDPMYWSDTKLTGSSQYVWHVRFDSGSVRNAGGSLSDTHSVRCVRSF